MATMEELDRDVRTFVQMYAWQRINPVPWAPMRVLLPEARIGLVVTACMTLPGQPPFQAEKPENDPTVRIVPSDTDPRTLVNTFPGQAFDHAGLEADADLLVPLDRLREMAEAGEIGGVVPRTVSMCGHITKPKRLIDEIAPEIARLFQEAHADAVVLVPA